MSYTQRLIKLNLLPLEHRREISDLTLLFKCKNNLASIDTTQYYDTRIPHYNTRNSDVNNLFPRMNHKQDYFRNSFFPRSAKLWNALPIHF